MNSLIRRSLAVPTVALCAALTTSAWADDLLPGQVDFGSFTAPKNGGEFVEVNVPAGLIALATAIVEKEDADVGKLLNGLKLVHVNVIGLDDSNRADLQKRMQKVKSEMTGKGWEHIVTAQQKDQDVGVYLKMTPKGAVQGLVAVVMDGNEHAVFVNVVGEIKPEQLAALGEKLHIDPLEKIGHAASKKDAAPADQKADPAPAAKEKPEQN